ncbi:MAG: FecCD family ABC transporter permease [Thermaurantiacus sp.]
MATLAPPAPALPQAAAGVQRVPLAWAILSALLCLSILLNLMLGAVPVPLEEVFRSLVPGAGADPAAALVIREIRLPRLLAALGIGAALAVSGAALQALFRNPLADPGLLGVSTGAALGAALWFVAGAGIAAAAAPALTPFLLPLASFLGALAAIFMVLALGSRAGPNATILMLLLGIGVNALGGALIGVATYLSTDNQLRALSVWLLGTLAQVEWPVLGVALGVISLTLVALLATARRLDLLALGEDSARHLGVDVPRLRILLAVLTALAVGAAVSLSGIIGFLGLVVPHMLRITLGPAHVSLLPLAALAGAVFLSMADLVARLIALPAEVPVGIVMAFIGAPLFIWVLLSAWRRMG